jgi:anthranilate/para-aminobenzoate synthase component II
MEKVVVIDNYDSFTYNLVDICPRESINKLIERYADDIELFGYRKAVDELLKDY